MLVLGGSDERDWRGRYRTAEVFDPRKGRFSPTGLLSRARFKMPDAVAVTQSGAVLVAGGAQVVDRFRAGRFLPVAKLDAARYYSTATLLRDGSLLIVGGYDQSITPTARSFVYKPLNDDVHLARAVNADGERLLDVGAAARAGDDRERARKLVPATAKSSSRPGEDTSSRHELTWTSGRSEAARGSSGRRQRARHCPCRPARTTPASTPRALDLRLLAPVDDETGASPVPQRSPPRGSSPVPVAARASLGRGAAGAPGLPGRPSRASRVEIR